MNVAHDGSFGNTTTQSLKSTSNPNVNAHHHRSQHQHLRSKMTEVNNNGHRQQHQDELMEEEEDDGLGRLTPKNKPLKTVYKCGSIAVEVTESEQWLCIARLPLDITELQLRRDILGEFGQVEKIVMIHSEKTGHFKGYALALYKSKSASIQARHVLDGQEINNFSSSSSTDNHILDCDWLRHYPGVALALQQNSCSAIDQSHDSTSLSVSQSHDSTSLSESSMTEISDSGQTETETLPVVAPPTCPVISLHSKCLFVDRLPENYRDMAEFRKIFSTVVNPPYCQIAMKNGLIQNWGLVEFTKAEQAEETLERLNGFEIKAGHKIRVQYCIPGVHAINIYMAFVNNPMDNAVEKKALMEEAPSTKVYDQLKSLAKQNPWFVQSLQNIMATTSSQNPSTNKTNSSQRQNSGHQKAAALLPQPPQQQSQAQQKVDPAQAALVLLLAGKAKNESSRHETSRLLAGIISQLEAGVSAADILKSMAANPNGLERPPLLGSPTSSSSGCSSPSSTSSSTGAGGGTNEDLNSIINSLVNSAQSMLSSSQLQKPQQQNVSSQQPSENSNSDPSLKDLLMKAFQARMKNGIYKPNCSSCPSTAAKSPPSPQQLQKPMPPPSHPPLSSRGAVANQLLNGRTTASFLVGSPSVIPTTSSSAAMLQPGRSSISKAVDILTASKQQQQPQQLNIIQNPTLTQLALAAGGGTATAAGQNGFQQPRPAAPLANAATPVAMANPFQTMILTHQQPVAQQAANASGNDAYVATLAAMQAAAIQQQNQQLMLQQQQLVWNASNQQNWLQPKQQPAAQPQQYNPYLLTQQQNIPSTTSQAAAAAAQMAALAAANAATANKRKFPETAVVTTATVNNPAIAPTTISSQPVYFNNNAPAAAVVTSAPNNKKFKMDQQQQLLTAANYAGQFMYLQQPQQQQQQLPANLAAAQQAVQAMTAAAQLNTNPMAKQQQ